MKKINRKVVLITDMSDVAVTEVMLRINKGMDFTVIPFVVNVNKFDLINGNFLIRLIADSMDSGDIILVVCDPRYSDVPRESIGVKLHSGLVVFGPNNGVFSMLFADDKPEKSVDLYISEESKKHPTFNGKYRFALAANRLLVGKKFGELGSERDLDDLYRTEISEGTVVHIDNYGNLKINLHNINYEVGEQLFVKIHNTVFPAVFAREFDDVEEGEMLVYPGSSLWGLPELAINRGSAAIFVDATVGDKLVISRQRD